MKPPIGLPAPGLDYWNRHAERLSRAGILTESDHESFSLLCLTWSKICELENKPEEQKDFRDRVFHVNLLKQYQSLAKQFGLLPRERQASKMQTEPAKPKDEFGL